MEGWRSLLRADPTPWLLGSDDALIRYRTLVDLMDRFPGDPRAVQAMDEAMSSGPIQKILARQAEGGHWGKEEHFYQRSKYKGTVWNVILLAELGARPEDPRIGRACDFLCRWAQGPSGGFTYKGGPEGGVKASLPCLTANLVCSLTRLGFGNGTAVLRARDYIAHVYDGEGGRERYHRCPACRSGKVKVLKALAELPEGGRSEAEEKAAATLSEAVLADCLPSVVPRTAPARPEWQQLGYPHMWDTDILEMLDVLAKLDKWDERMRPALEIILSKQDDEGRWTMERSFNRRFLTSIERDGEPSRWVTLRALTLLKRLPGPKQSLC
jgi:hypothetical protein